MSWFGLLPAFFVAAALLIVPGWAVLCASGARWTSSILFAAPVSLGLVGVGTVGAGAGDVGWNIAVYAVFSACVVIVALALRWLVSRRWGTVELSPAIERPSVWLLLPVVLSALVIGFPLVRAFGQPDAFSQTFDAVFHLNASRFAAETGVASPFRILEMTSAGGPTDFYPSVWHALVALVIQLTGTSPAPATIAMVLAVATLVWPLSALAFATTMVRLRRVPAALAVAAIVGMSGFPYLLVDYGVLYPNYLAYATIPSLLALMACAVSLAQHRLLPVQSAILGALIGAAGVALTHPNAAMLVLACAIPALAILAFRIVRSSPTALRIIVVVVACLVVALAYALVWETVRPSAASSGWRRTTTMPEAFGEFVLGAGYGRAAAWVIAPFAVVGAVHLLRSKSRGLWAVGAWILIGGLYMVVAGMENQDLRYAITGVWFNNAPRLAAAIPLLAVPLAIVGLTVAWERGRSWCAARIGSATTWVLAGLLVAAVVVGPLRTIAAETGKISTRYAAGQSARLVDADELALIEQLPELLPPDSVVAVNPWRGGAMAYALEGVDVTHKHLITADNPDLDLIDNELRDAVEGSQVCEAIQREGVNYVLDFPLPEVHGGNHAYPGLDDLEDSSAVELVASVGDAKLYRVTACE